MYKSSQIEIGFEDNSDDGSKKNPCKCPITDSLLCFDFLVAWHLHLSGADDN